MPPPPKGCIFCGKSPTTKEHVIPRWAGKLLARTKPLPSQPGRVVVGVFERWSEGAKEDVKQKWRMNDALEITAKCVCAACNHGWMSDVENAAKAIVSAMMDDQRTMLNTAAQEKVAKWLGLRAIIGQYALPPGQAYREWAQAFAFEGCPPTSWQVRIGRYQGARPAFSHNTSLNRSIMHPLVPFVVKSPGFLFTVQLGHFVGQVLGVRQQNWVVPSQRCFIQIWPHPLLRASAPNVTQIVSVDWPPESWLDDSDLKKCARDPAEPKR
jgi:hypothetical protein